MPPKRINYRTGGWKIKLFGSGDLQKVLVAKK